MQIVNMHEAKTHLSRLIEAAIHGESFIIAKAGKPLVKVTAIDQETIEKKRIGFLKSQIGIPDDFNMMGQTEIEKMFEGGV